MAIEIFNRFEKKYIVNDFVFDKIQPFLLGLMDIDDYNKANFTYPICNIYYDTNDSYLVRKSLEKPVYKEKLRLRSYGTPNAASTIFIEIKKKYQGKVNKRRSSIKLYEAYQFIESGQLPVIQPYMNAQVLREIQFMLSQMTLEPAIALSYHRRAFKDVSDLRVSFDTDIRVRKYDMQLEYGIYGESLLPEGMWIMEIKTAQAIPTWLSKLLALYDIKPVSISKYGLAYQKFLSGELLAEEESDCLNQYFKAS